METDFKPSNQRYSVSVSVRVIARVVFNTSQLISKPAPVSLVFREWSRESHESDAGS